jgi:hypothetical protein
MCSGYACRADQLHNGFVVDTRTAAPSAGWQWGSVVEKISDREWSRCGDTSTAIATNDHAPPGELSGGDRSVSSKQLLTASDGHPRQIDMQADRKPRQHWRSTNN